MESKALSSPARNPRRNGQFSSKMAALWPRGRLRESRYRNESAKPELPLSQQSDSRFRPFHLPESKTSAVGRHQGSFRISYRWGDREQRHPQGLLTEQPCSQAHGRGGRAYLPGSHGAPTLVFWEKRWGAGGALIQIRRKVTINKPEEELSFTKKACCYVRWYGQKHLAGRVLKKKGISQQSVFIHILFLFCFSLHGLALTMDDGHQRAWTER